MATTDAAGPGKRGVEPDTVLFAEDFSEGLDVGGRFQLVPVGDGLADDGVVSRTATGVTVAPPARHPETGAPQFTKDVPGYHLKWLVASTESIPLEGEVRFAFRAGARCHAVAEHPYGDDVSDPDADLRLGSLTLNVLDFATGVVFDFWVCNTAIYAFHERLRLPGQPGEFQTFGSISKPAPSAAGEVHDLAIVVDAAAGHARWEVDGVEIARVDAIGAPQPGWDLIMDHGGTPETAVPLSMSVGMGLMTLLDASLPPAKRGLVDIGTGYVHPADFRGGPTLFGQGVELMLEDLTVTRR